MPAPVVRAYILGFGDHRFRGDQLVAFLDGLSIPYERVHCIDAKQMPSSFFAEKYDGAAARLAYGSDLNPGEIACVLGHEEMYRRFLATGEEWAIMFEDDATMLCDPQPVVSAIGRLPAPSIVQLNANLANLVLHERILPIDTPIGSITLRRQYDAFHGAHAYLINRAAAAVAAEHADRFRVLYCPDWPFLWRSKVEFWDVYPEISPRPDNVSMIDNLSERKANRLADPFRLRRIFSDLTGYSSLRLAWLGYPLATCWNEKVGRSITRNLLRLRQRFGGTKGVA